MHPLRPNSLLTPHPPPIASPHRSHPDWKHSKVISLSSGGLRLIIMQPTTYILLLCHLYRTNFNWQRSGRRSSINTCAHTAPPLLQEKICTTRVLRFDQPWLPKLALTGLGPLNLADKAYLALCQVVQRSDLSGSYAITISILVTETQHKPTFIGYSHYIPTILKRLLKPP